MFSQGELHALRLAAEHGWADDTRHDAYQGHPLAAAGQCYVTSRWLADRLGGDVGRKDGHYFYLTPGRTHGLDLTGDQTHYPPENPNLEGLRVDEDDPGLQLQAHHHMWRPGPIIYKPSTHPYFSGYEVMPPAQDERTARFAARANQAFDTPDQLLARTADLVGDAYPGEEPQAVEDMNQRYMHDEPGHESGSGEYRFVYAGGQLEVSADHSHEELAGHAGIAPDHTGPVAVGHIFVNQGQARFEVTGNIAGNALFRVLKDYCKHVGWKWGGLTDNDGWPISDTFAPKQTSRLYFALRDGSLALSPRFARVASKEARILGAVVIDEIEQTLHVQPTRLPHYFASLPAVPREDMRLIAEGVLDLAADRGLTVLAGDGNVLKTVEDLSEHNLYDPNPTQPDDHQYPAAPVDERQPGGVYRCPNCQQIFPTWNLYQRHRRDEEPMGDLPDREPNQDDGLDAEPALGVQEQYPYVQMSSVREAQRVPGFDGHQDGDEYVVAYRHGCAVGYARMRKDRLSHAFALKGIALWPIVRKVVALKGQSPKDLIEGPVPFIYDVQEDSIDMGQPNQRTSDIPGRFTPGGIVEGMYEPGGKVVIRTQTNMPYTVRHLLELWYASNPMLEVKSVHLQDDGGGDTKLAASNVGGYIAAMVAADPAASTAAQALQAAGGHVFAVGGAVRDALMGKEPKDIDLMVSGLPSDAVHSTLAQLPGRVDLTGNDFGVYRYRTHGDDVEIALPRRERSTGSGHQDFDVQADHTMSPEEDLYRRDFTANAMAVDLSSGQLVDPYGGAEDVARGTLRSVSPDSLSEDPLRVVRGVVAHGKHGLVPDSQTREQMALNAPNLTHLPPERLQAELDKLFAAKDPASAIRLAHETGVLPYVLPEVDDAFGFDQRNPHHELELGEHLLNVLHRTAEQTGDPDLRLAALMHDIGKPASAWQDPDPERGFHYYYNKDLGLGQDHETVGADMTRERMRALKYPNDRIDRVNDLVQHHMFAPFTSTRGARRFLNRVGEHADDLLTLRQADQGGKTVYPTDPSLSVDDHRQLLQQVRDAGEATDASGLAINGHDLMAAGIPAGPQMGQILRSLTEQVIENPELNTREALLAMAEAAAGSPVQGGTR